MQDSKHRPTSIQAAAEHDPRWAAVKARDSSADDKFVYAVKTTGVYCRPSSPSRLPHPRNVVFFNTPEEAMAAGYRPSKRAAADHTAVLAKYAKLVEQACRTIELSDDLPSLSQLAAQAGLSPFHFHRVFKSVAGLTPKEYAMARRALKIRSRLGQSESITDAIYDSGFGSNSRFYEAADQRLGMKPRTYRSGGENTTIHFAIGECTLGSILVAQSHIGICAILMGEDPQRLARELQDLFPRADLVGGDANFEQLVATVVGFIEAPSIGLSLPLDIRGTAFQERVWKALREIPAGTTVNYTELAKRIGAPAAVRAVASACAANRLAVAIPCHRVIRSDGGLSGYRWGVERKRELLDREAGIEGSGSPGKTSQAGTRLTR